MTSPLPTHSPTPDSTSSVTPTPQPKVHFGYLDGIRALAAMYVILNHCSGNIQFNITNKALELSGVLGKAQSALFFLIFRFGHYAVNVFIVLSGFCLMLPIARAGSDKLHKGIADYIQRRARRILPPYYAALFLALLLTFLIKPLQTNVGIWGGNLPAFTFGAIGSHLLLIHNWTPYILKINSPLWSIAVEWQIYFFFPALLWLKRKSRMSVAILIAFVVGLMPHYLFGPQTDNTYPWYLGLFAIGMATADLCFNKTRPKLIAFREKMPWLPLTIAFFVVVALLSTVQNASFQNRPGFSLLYKYIVSDEWKVDIFVGLMAVCLIIFCAEQTRKGNSRSLVLRMLNHPALVAIGTYSYSLYLVHMPVIGLVDVLLKALHLSPTLFLGVMYFLTVPICLPIAYGFHRLFERPFMSSNAQKAAQKADALQSNTSVPANV